MITSFFKKRKQENKRKQIVPKRDLTPEDLTSAIIKLNTTIRSRTHRTRAFLNGLMAGVGTAIGATVVAGTALLVLTQILKQLDFIPWVQQILENMG